MTIVERAYRFACKNDKWTSFFVDLEKGYIGGAKEQKSIDIEKACQYLKSKCDYLDGECILHLDFNLEEFKKEMEKDN